MSESESLSVPLGNFNSSALSTQSKPFRVDDNERTLSNGLFNIRNDGLMSYKMYIEKCMAQDVIAVSKDGAEKYQVGLTPKFLEDMRLAFEIAPALPIQPRQRKAAMPKKTHG